MSSTPEQREKWKQQREKHKDKRHEYGRQYYQVNKETELERAKKWRELNPDRVKEHNEISEIKRLVKITCDVCGCETSHKHLNRHKQTKACIATLANQT